MTTRDWELPALSPFGAAFGEAMEPAKPEHIEAAKRDAQVRRELIAEEAAAEESAFARAQREMSEREAEFAQRRAREEEAAAEVPLPKALRKYGID